MDYVVIYCLLQQFVSIKLTSSKRVHLFYAYLRRVRQAVIKEGELPSGLAMTR